MKGLTSFQSFSKSVSEAIGYYVYRLIDPRNGETFYVGKGKGNRVFEHAADKAFPDEGDLLPPKRSRIRSIISAGFEVSHIIHRHKLSEESAYEVEAALIDAYPGLTNEVSGHGADDRGVVHTKEIIERYSAETVSYQHSVIEIAINTSLTEKSPYDATRFAWRISADKARQADFVVSVHNGIIRHVFVAEEWAPAGDPRFGDLTAPLVKGRFGFFGHEAPNHIKQLYVGKMVEVKPKGAANPIRYKLLQ